MEPMPVFTRMSELLRWSLQVSNHFPRARRHDFTQRMLGAVFDLREALEVANMRRASARKQKLYQADEASLREPGKLAGRYALVPAPSSLLNTGILP